MKKKKGLSMRGKQNATGWGFLAPAIILITLFSLYPMISALITSFQTGTGTNMKFCSFSNYIRCLQDDVFVQSIKIINDIAEVYPKLGTPLNDIL